MITRYRIAATDYIDGRIIMHEDQDGEWCRWEDVEPELKKLKAEIDRLNAQVDYLQKDNARIFYENKRLNQLLNHKPFSHSTCPKVKHSGDGYMHDPDDNTPYQVDGLTYCGRCHSWISEGTE